MDIKSVRHATELSQKAFSERFGIPIGTLRNWEQGIIDTPTNKFVGFPGRSLITKRQDSSRALPLLHISNVTSHFFAITRF